MACEDKCEWVTWEADQATLHNWIVVEPACANLLPALPVDVEDQLTANVMNENSSRTPLGCPDCDCVETGPAVLVLTAQKYRVTNVIWTAPNGSQCTIAATFKVRLRKWRTPGECAPRDEFVA